MSFLQDFAFNLDRSVYFFFQPLQQYLWLHPFLSWSTHLGAIGILLALLGIGILFYDRPQGWKRALTILAIVEIQHLAMIFLKALFSRPRPFMQWENVSVLGHFPGNDSFPSGHTSDTVAAAFLLNYFYPGAGKWAYPLAFLVALSRIYRGVHYPTDLIAGAAWGIAFAAFSIVLLSVLKILPKLTAAK